MRNVSVIELTQLRLNLKQIKLNCLFLVQQNTLSHSQLEKSRIMLSFICFLSLLPSILGQIIQLLIKCIQPEPGGLLSIALSLGLLCDVTMSQLCEEICMIIFCEDLRMLIRKQFSFFFKSSDENNVTQITLSTNSISVRSTYREEIVNDSNQAFRIRTITV